MEYDFQSVRKVLGNDKLSDLNRKLIARQIEERDYIRRVLPLVADSEEEREQVLYEVLEVMRQEPMTKDYFPPLRDVVLDIQYGAPITCE